MKCKKCGAAIEPGQKFCKMCGNLVSDDISNGQVTSNGQNNTMNTNMSNMNYQTPIQSQYFQYQHPVPKKNNNGIIIAVVAIVAVAFIGVTFMLTTNRNTSNNSNSNSNIPVTPVSSTTKVKYSGFVFQVPDDYLYEIESNGFVITDDKTWAANIKVASGSYDTLKINKDKLKVSAQDKGFQASDVTVKNYNGFELVTFEVTNNGVTHIFAYGKASSTKFFAIEAIARNGQADYTILDKISPILNGAIYEGETQNTNPSNIPDNALIDATNGIS